MRRRLVGGYNIEYAIEIGPGHFRGSWGLLIEKYSSWELREAWVCLLKWGFEKTR